jgi:group I intron endonuclease
MEYKFFKNEPAVYKIKCLINDKIYIGSSVNLRNRINRHYNDLVKQKHTSKHLQNAFNLYGNENFIVEVLEFCDRETLIQKEQFFLDKLKPWDRLIGYNTCEIAGLPSKRKLTEEQKAKISKSLKGRVVSDETKKKISEGNKGKIQPKEAVEKSRLANIGRKHSEDSVEKRARKYSFIDTEGNIYVGTNLKRFAEQYGLHRFNLMKVLTGERKSHKGFKKYNGVTENQIE